MFFQAILLFPDVQRKAKEEIDSVIGFERVVNFDDQPSLPYMEALYREVLRWKQVLPLSVAHASTLDDVYKGYYIPKGETYAIFTAGTPIDISPIHRFNGSQ